MKTLNPLMTLQSIRGKSPCSEGWTKLLRSLGYADGKFDPSREVSLGDIARSNDSVDAMWCIRALDWSDISVRRAVIAGAILPAVKRASKHTKERRVFAAIEAIEKWCDGDNTVDLRAAADAADAAADTDAYAAYAAAYAAYAAAYAADADAADAAAYAAYAANAADAADAAAARKAEREQQRQDIIAAFPPVATKG